MCFVLSFEGMWFMFWFNFNFFFYIFLDRENYDGVGDRYKLEGGGVGCDIGSW